MKKFMLLMVLSLVFGSCTTFIYTGKENAWYAVRKIDGKEQWGAVSERYVRGISSDIYDADGNKVKRMIGYVHMSSAERELKRQLGYWPFSAIEIKYDSIKFVDFHGYDMFHAYKDGKHYYYDGGFWPIADEQPVERVEYISRGSSLCLNNMIEAKFYLSDGTVYTTDRGPVEDINVGYWGYALKKNGKWGYYYGRSDIKAYRNFVQTVPFAYDEIIESIDMNYQNHLVFACKDNVWDTYNRFGEKLPTDGNLLNEALARRKKSGNANADFFFYGRE